MCDGITTSNEILTPIINPEPQIGDIWVYNYTHEGCDGKEHHLILEVDSGTNYKNATTLCLETEEVESYLDVDSMMRYHAWTKEA